MSGNMLSARLVLEGTLLATSPLCVGGVHADGIVDASPATDGSGDYYLPGTSIAGAIRSWILARVEDGQSVCVEWWGAPGKGEKTPKRASRVIVDDAPITVPAGGSVEVRDGVGIDRGSGAAHAGRKYDRSVLPAASTAPLRVVFECRTSEAEQQAKKMAKTLVTALTAGDISLGAATTRGLGRVRLVEPRLCLHGLGTRESVLQTLRGGVGELELERETCLQLRARPSMRVTVDWQPDGPLMVASGDNGLAVAHLPLVASSGEDDVVLVLPGSSIKGAFRSQAERIVRTVRPDVAFDESDFSRQLDVPFVGWLFGSAPDVPVSASSSASSDEPASAAPPGVVVPSVKKPASDDALKAGRAAAAFADCLSAPLPRAVWDGLRYATDNDELRHALAGQDSGGQKGTPPGRLDAAYHVAVDRWTAAPADGLLFSGVEPFVAWDPIELTIDFDRVPVDEHKAAIALMVLLLQDVAGGLVPLGHAVNRGYGRVSVGEVCFELCDVVLTGDGTASSVRKWTLSAMPSDVLESLRQAWGAWCEKDGVE